VAGLLAAVPGASGPLAALPAEGPQVQRPSEEAIGAEWSGVPFEGACFPLEVASSFVAGTGPRSPRIVGGSGFGETWRAQAQRRIGLGGSAAARRGSWRPSTCRAASAALVSSASPVLVPGIKKYFINKMWCWFLLQR
jgi:hypothetical protein